MATTTTGRSGVVTFKGNPMTLIGPELKVGDKIPDFELVGDGLSKVTWNDLSEGGTKAVLMVLVPSIDTGVCSLETGKFNKHAANLPGEKISVVTISADTPFAQKRWATQEGIENLKMLSDHKEKAFATSMGVLMKELGLLARSIYIVDKGGVIRYIQTVPEVATEPDYDAVLNAAHEVAAA
jgi:thiol peroxidase